MADGFQGLDIISRRQTAIQTPIGFFGLSVSVVDYPNLFIKVVDSAGRSVRNCSVTTSNPSSGIPKSSNTDTEGNVALKSDATSTITILNGKSIMTYNYVRANVGNQITILFKIKMIL